MKTYQDLLKVVYNKSKLNDFITSAISDHKTSTLYYWAREGKAYDKQQNTTIMSYRKMLGTISGGKIEDIFSANHKLASNFYRRFNVQENQYLLGNGVTFENEDTKNKLGFGKYDFDVRLQKLGKTALTQRVAYGFWNLDHVDVFDAMEFVPLYDEEDGSLKAGIRFWQIADNKPMRVTLYEMDGYTEYIKQNGETIFEELKPKRKYVLKTHTTEADGTEIYDGENYAGFPVVPLWGNPEHTSNIQAWQSKIDCYDLIESGFANDVDDATLIYWVITNAGGMDNEDLAEWLYKLRSTHTAQVQDDGAKVEGHTMDIPVNARETYLKMLEKDLYKDAMALDTEAIANGNTVATAIRAAYEPLNNKTDEFEYCVIEFIQNILELAGIDDAPTFKRSTIVNQTEETQMVLSAAQFLDDETILKHLPFISPDEVENILGKMEDEEMDRFDNEQGEGEGEGEEQPEV